jgi:ribonuclease III
VRLSLPSLAALAERLGLSPESESLRVALTHSSYAAEHDVESNERFEFLGDAVVDLVVADIIVTEYPYLTEGTGSLVRSRVVNEHALADAARHLRLADYVRLGRGEVKAQGAERASLLADTFEAVVAALYLERGYGAAKKFVRAALGEAIAHASASPDAIDPKTRLRQWAETTGRGTPHYEVESSGPAHATQFYATASIGGVVLGRGRGRSKKRAEARAAEDAWESRDA